MNLAIKGHPTRGKEVIEILEMLGGVNSSDWECSSEGLYYSVSTDCFGKEGVIIVIKNDMPNYMYFTLEDFLEKYPYKVGDEVKNARINDFIGIVTNVRWDDNEKQIIYVVEWDDVTKSTLTHFARGLQPYKKELQNKPDLFQQLKEYFDNTPREVVEKEWHEYGKYNEISPKVNEYLEYVNNIRQSKYPKTYKECCEVLDFDPDRQTVTGYDAELIENFQTLKLCRDAYWKIAGGWKPDYMNPTKETMYFIFCNGINIEQGQGLYPTNKVLIFPTEEMRDAFYENFKDLIEQCKELL